MHTVSVLAIAPAHAMRMHSGGRVSFKTIIPSGANHRSTHLFGLRHELHSQIAEMPIYRASDNSGAFVADAGHFGREEVLQYLAEQEAFHAIDSSGWHDGHGLMAAAESLSAYRAAQPLLEHGSFDAVYCEGGHLLDAGYRLSREHGIPLVAGVTWPSYANSLHAGVHSRLSRVLSHASGLIANDPTLLSPLSRLGAVKSNRAISSDLTSALDISTSIRECRQLSALARDSSRPQEERRQAMDFLKKLSSRTGSSSAHFVRYGRVAAIAPAFDSSFDYSPQAARARAGSLRAIAGGQLGGDSRFGVLAGTHEGFVAFSRAFSLLPKDSVALAFMPHSLEADAARSIAGIGLSSRIAFASVGDAGLMSACSVIACPDGLAVPRQSIAAATHAASAVGGPALFFGPRAPAIYAACETNFGHSAAADAKLIMDASSSPLLKSRFKREAQAAMAEEWSKARHQAAVIDYFEGFFK